MNMKEIAIKDIELNPFITFGENWAALAAGNRADGYNAMTIAWGHFGTLWERGSHSNRLPTAIFYVRPGRYTKRFLDKEPYFTVSCFDSKYKKALGYLGSHSGRDGDKIKSAGLTPEFAEDTVYFSEAQTVYICRKLYQSPLIEAGFVDKGLIDFNYPAKDFHEMYIGEIIKVLRAEAV